ncbi:piggyBac transposable element-derived protein 4-like [Periplaneta americana]|uniref:piggyBac transposable element-derived protein 4-like n=1 Tax=Periplaneta americana TaxID=6978 RepID=UPI0037E946EB
MAASYGETATFTRHLDELELKAFIGLVFLAGIFKSNHEDVDSLFATDGTGRDIFRATMTKEQYLFLLSALRFDNIETREERKRQGNKLAAISEVFDSFINNCNRNYCSSEYTTVDEMLVGFHGRCSFRVYLKGKPQKYGLKIMCLCDAKTHYLINAFVYAGKICGPNPQQLSVPTRSVLSLVLPISETNRNVKGDNWFTSVELMDELRKIGLTYVGTVRKNKKEIPPQFLPDKKREVGSTKFGFTRDKTIVSFVPKKSKAVILMSSMHHDSAIHSSGKPDMIMLYNARKAGVDALDQKCALYRTGRRCRRWPLAIWYAMLDILTVNGHIILRASDKDYKKSRHNFIMDLGMELILGHLKVRATISTLPRELRQMIVRFAGIRAEVLSDADTQLEGPPKRRRCCICPRNSDKKHPTVCSVCHRTVFKSHSEQRVICHDCKDRD